MIPRPMLIALAVVAISAVAASIYGLGRESAEAEINQLNQEAGDAADQASSVFERCIDDGGVFDFATGQCRGR
jgi:type II secretory pathway pseudopilin PulG